MKKSFLMIIAFFGLIFGIVRVSYATDAIDYGTYDNAVSMLQEVMKSYYVRGPYIQYNLAKATYGLKSPEDVTSQEIKYDTCAGFVCDVYSEAFGMECGKDLSNSEFPIYVSYIMEHALSYYNDENTSKDGNYLLYYQNNNDVKYIYGSENEDILLSDFIGLLKPGDLLVYTGHVLLVYDIVESSDGTKDVLLMNASQGPYIQSRSIDTNRLSYNIFPSDIDYLKDMDKLKDLEKNEETIWDYDILDTSYLREGAIQLVWLSDVSNFIDENNNLSCNVDECAIIRPFYANEDGSVGFNYQIKNNDKYEKSKLRLEYRGLFIEKTVDVGDNNSIYIGDEITYTIRIANKSGIGPSNGSKYEKFYIEEVVDDNFVELIDANDGVYDSANKILMWEFDNLDVNEEITIEYVVKVKNNLDNVNKYIESVGGFYSDSYSDVVSISTGKVVNKIVPKVLGGKNNYKTCYDKYVGNYEYLELVNKVYECVYGENVGFDFTDFSFTNLFEKTIPILRTDKDALTFYENSNESVFYRMILNNYWSGMVGFDLDKDLNIDYYDQAKWIVKGDLLRADTINSGDFKEGDVLIYYINYDDDKNMNYDSTNCYSADGSKMKTCLYVTPEDDRHTNELGRYAYIYIDGKFVGNNNKTNSKYIRNEFTYDYYLDTDGLTIKSDLYTGNEKIPSGKRSSYLEFANYQTLYDKDYYVILRPSMAIQEIAEMEINTDSLKKNYIFMTDEFDLTDIKLKVKYNNGEEKIVTLPSEEVSVSGFDNTKLGKNTITVEYQDHILTFDVNVTIFNDSVDIDNMIINNISVGTSIDDLLSKLVYNGEVIVTDRDNNTLESGNLKTGDKVRVVLEDEIFEYKVSVNGDVDGNGNLNLDDIILTAKYIINNNTISDLEYINAADIDDNDVININDVIKLVKMVNG